MEIFILQSGKPIDVDLLKKTLRAKKNFTRSEQDQYHKRYTLPFWIYLASTLHSINQGVTYPLIMWMLLMEYRGLSRLGKILCNFCNLSPNVRTYDTIRDQMIFLAGQQVAKLTDEGFCTVAIDNYTHRYGSATLRLNRTTQYQMPTFTVGAVVRWPGSILIDIQFLKDDASHLFLGSVPAKYSDMQIYEEKVPL
jgi:hypothetical protein